VSGYAELCAVSNFSFLRGASHPDELVSQAKLKPVKPHIKKSVYGVYNVSSDENVRSYEDFVTKLCGAKPIICFKVKTSNGDNNNTNVNDDKPGAYRICIYHQYSVKFLNAQAWANGIVIKA